VFDCSAPDTEHFQVFHFAANSRIPKHFRTKPRRFGILGTERWANGYATRAVRVATEWTVAMSENDPRAPLALRPRDAAKLLGISPRTLWQWTRDGVVPCARVGKGNRCVVLYSVADLQAWLTRQADAANGGDR
jgi:excisionase family DNA binding protein